MKTTIIIVIIVAAVIAVLAVFLPTGTVEAPGNTDAAEACEDDVRLAQEASLDQICTQQFEELRCPHETVVTYEAPNGCEIGFLKQRGWTSLEETGVE